MNTNVTNGSNDNHRTTNKHNIVYHYYYHYKKGSLSSVGEQPLTV